MTEFSCITILLVFVISFFILFIDWDYFYFRAQTKGALKTGRLYMIDLAGSERAAQTEVKILLFE